MSSQWVTRLCRLEFWGDEIIHEALDAWTQRSIKAVEHVRLLPAARNCGGGCPEPTSCLLKDIADERVPRPRVRVDLQRDLAEGRILQEQELLLPYYRVELGSFDYLVHASLVWCGPGRSPTR